MASKRDLSGPVNTEAVGEVLDRLYNAGFEVQIGWRGRVNVDFRVLGPATSDLWSGEKPTSAEHNAANVLSAVRELAEEAATLRPESQFAQWWRGFVQRFEDRERLRSRKALTLPELEPGAEDRVGVSLDELSAVYALESLRGFGPQKFKELHRAGISPALVLRDPTRLPIAGKLGAGFRSDLDRIGDSEQSIARERATRQIATADRLKAVILTYNHPRYPHNVFESNNPVPVIYVRGSVEVVAAREAVACVGSRGIRPPYTELHAAFARIAAAERFTVVSGFAMGADRIGHEAAWKADGTTLCVLPGGLDRPFPPENKDLWDALLSYPSAALVSEFPFGLRASALTLRKRNKLIVSFGRGVLIGQSSDKGGAMNAYRFALEQRKPLATFEDDGTDSTSGNRRIGGPPAAGTVFPRSAPNADAFVRWLQQLSSST